MGFFRPVQTRSKQLLPRSRLGGMDWKRNHMNTQQNLYYRRDPSNCHVSPSWDHIQALSLHSVYYQLEWDFKFLGVKRIVFLNLQRGVYVGCTLAIIMSQSCSFQSTSQTRDVWHPDIKKISVLHGAHTGINFLQVIKVFVLH